MANKSECIACRKAQAEKHKKDKGWKIAAIVSSLIAILFIVLYFGSGTVIETTEIENEVTVENIGGGNPTNSNIGNINAGNRENDTAIIVAIVVVTLLILGGLIYGYFMAKKNRQEQGDGAEFPRRGEKDDGES